MSKKIISVFLLVSLIISSLFQTNVTIVRANESENLVEVVSAEATTSYSDGNNAQKAFDHNSGTRWTSNIGLDDSNKNQQYLEATLSNEVDLSRLEITWFTPWINEYRIEVSTDGQSWREAVVSSVVTEGTEINESGAEGLKQKVTEDSLVGFAASHIRIAMTDVDISRGPYLSIVDVSVYSKSVEGNLISMENPVLHNIGSYGQNTVDKMIDGTTDTAGNRWTSNLLSMSKEDVTNCSIEFRFENAINLTRFEVDWFNTPVTKYSLSISDSDEGEFTKVVDAKTMPAADMVLPYDQLTHTSDLFMQNQRVKRVLLSFDDANAGGYLSICEVRAYGVSIVSKEPWEINLIGENATATASSVQAANMEADKAIDGNRNTRWASSFYEQPSYLLIDLKEEISFDQMKIYQEASYAKAFNVEVSTNNQTYTKVYETNKGQVGTNDIYFGDEINARYVKINFTEYGYYSAYSIWEVELFNNGAERMYEMVSNELSVPSKISSQFKLPAAVQNMKIVWTSTSDLLNIDESGNVKVTIPESNTDIELIANLKYGNQNHSIRFNSVVLSSDNRQVNYEIYPIPQEMTLGENNIELSETINVVLSDQVKNVQSLKNRINEVFNENGYQLAYTDQLNDEGSNLLIGVNGDGSIADTYVDANGISKDVFAESEEKRYDKHVVSLDDKKNIVILSQDADSAYFGLATLDLMFESAQSEEYFGSSSKRMTTVFIEDFADMQYRGVIEGFYGWPWSLEDRLSYAEFAKRYKLNYFAYGPKSDPYHLSKWNSQYPTNETITDNERELGVMTQEEFRVLIDKFNDSNIDFVWSIHPAMGDNKIDFNDQNSIASGQTKIMKKYESMYNLGVRQFGLFVDDIDLTVAYNNRVYIADMVDGIQGKLYEKWGRAYDNESDENAIRPLMFVPSHYFLTFGDSSQNEASIREFARIHDDVIITFTGDGCWSSVVEDHAKTFAQRAGREPLFWWNYSTNDVMDDQLFTDKVDSYYSMNNDVTSLYGFVSNPMNEAELSKISLFGIADYAWNIHDFDSSRDYDAYFKVDFEDQSLAEAYKNVAINLDKNGKSLTSEKELFNKILNDFNENSTCNTDDINKLRIYASNLQDSLQKIKQFKTSDKKEYQNLYDEMLPWLNKLSDMSRMTLELCDYLDYPDIEVEWNLFASHLVQLDAFTTDDKYAFVSLELNVSNAQSSYLRNVVVPNEPLLNFIKGMNGVLKTKFDESKNGNAEIITNVSDYKNLIVNNEGDISLTLENINLNKNDYIGIAFNKILHVNLDMSSFIEQGLYVEYSLNGKEWMNDAVDFAYVRLINKDNTTKSITGNILVGNDTVSAEISTNMTAYDGNDIGNVVDDDLSTKFWKWGAQSKGDYITLKYEELIDLSNLGFYFDSSDNGSMTDVPQKAYVQVSINGSDWETIAEINKEDIQSVGNGLYYMNVNDIDKEVQYVRYLVEEPSSGQWFRLVEIATNEKFEKPQAMIENRAAENVNDGNVTTYSKLSKNKELIYQVIDNLNIKEISLLAIPQWNEQINANIRVYASRTNYSYNNVWIDLGNVDNVSSKFDVSNLYNLQKISIVNEGEDINIFEIQLNGDVYVDDTQLQYVVDQAVAKVNELEGINLDAYTVSSRNLFRESLNELKNQLSSYQTLNDVQAVLNGLEQCYNVLVEKGDDTNLRKLYEETLKVDNEYYTEDSYKALSNTLKEVEELLNNIDDADQRKIDLMLEKLNGAINVLQYKSGDYSKVEEAVNNAESLNKDYYKDFSEVAKAVNAVVTGKNITEQAVIDAMAKAINDAINALEYKDADYTAVNEAIAKANKLNKDDYKDFSAVTKAVSAVVTGKNITEQAAVDAMAKAINDAIAGLEKQESTKPGRGEVEVGEKDPTNNSTIKDSINDKLQAIIDEKLNEGKDVQINVHVNELTAANMSEEQKADIACVATFIKENKGNVGYYFDISILVESEGTKLANITETVKKLQLKLSVPEEMKKEGRTFTVVRVHDGKVEELPTTEEDGVLTFETDKFSVYAIIYKDAPTKLEAANTSDNSMISSFMTTLLLSGLALIVLKKKENASN